MAVSMDTWHKRDHGMESADGKKRFQTEGIGREGQRSIVYESGDHTIRFAACRYQDEMRVMLDRLQVSPGIVVNVLRPEYNARPLEWSDLIEFVQAVQDVLPLWPRNAAEEARPARLTSLSFGGFDKKGRPFQVSYAEIAGNRERYRPYISQSSGTIYILDSVNP